MRLVLATRNPGKVAELRARLAGLPVELISAADVDGAPEVDEDRETLRGNAEKKARALHAHTGLAALADDTGLEVDALGGAPGVHSARFAGPDADDAQNRAHLVRQLEGADDRSARFRTVLAFVDGAGAEFFDGVCEGTLLSEERGSGGFGYDALFVPADGDGRTFAEMGKAEKNVISHRGRALEAFTTWLSAR
ncbi:MAG TPA: RdgB/HAM1 family non-canonical purine NTP pyrophosphatase [Bacteroidetes bacterium]|nr:RdgB/HAM1 family non-canonical purine NTP pyrophosphatase [Bacteroidota bacterium]HIL58047.1 RdgB/HAM1 family non-canonical purine NTP pyrophosphatase [Rhodothermales bacterium]